jgi:hypothetical protein
MKALALVAIAGFALVPVFSQTAKSTTAAKVPTFKYDGACPRLPLPNAWTFEGITGLESLSTKRYLFYTGLEALSTGARVYSRPEPDFRTDWSGLRPIAPNLVQSAVTH